MAGDRLTAFLHPGSLPSTFVIGVQTSPVLKKVNEEADRLAANLTAKGAPGNAVWQVLGVATAGKSALLQAVAPRLAAKHLVPIFLTPPPRAIDTGAAALVQLSATLRSNGLGNGLLDSVIDLEIPWSEKLASVRKALSSSAKKVVLLVDEPIAWPFPSPEESMFRDRTEQVIEAFVRSAPCRRVIAGALPGGTPNPIGVHELKPSTVPSEWLRDASQWGSLTNAAAQLDESFGPELRNHSQLEIRLLVALTALMGIEVVASLRQTFRSRRAIAERLTDLLSSRKELMALRTLWAKLQLVRHPFEPDLLSLLGEGGLGTQARDILRQCILFEQDGRLVLHEILRIDAREHRWIHEPTRRATHHELAKFYRTKFSQKEEQAQLPDRLQDEMEAFFHASSSGDIAATEGLREFFVDQLDLLGRELSIRARRWRPPDEKLLSSAADVFVRATKWDPNDAYAFHYRAFNLDIAGLNAPEVERCFREAIRLDPKNVWWRSRLISFLITRGRTPDAETEWDLALDALGLPDENSPAFVYENMHVWVARLLVHRGQLDFAQRVLQGIPASVLRNRAGLSAFARRGEVLSEARRTGAYVPAELLVATWWSRGPALLPSRLMNKAELQEWTAARVDEIDEQRIFMRVARIRDSRAEPNYGTLEMSFEDFDRWSGDGPATQLSAGRFVEIGRYAPGDEIRIRIHPTRRWRDPALPRLFPDPTRYLRRGFATVV